MPPLVKRWCRNLPGLNQLLLFQSLCECLSIPSELYWHKKRSARPNIPQAMQSRSVLLKNMFDPEESVFLIIDAMYLTFSFYNQRNWTWLGQRSCWGRQRGMWKQVWSRDRNQSGEGDTSEPWCSFFLTYRWPYVGRDLCQIRCYRKRQKGHSRTQWPLVWWTTSICSLYLWRYHASSSIGCSKQDLRRYPTKNHFFDTDAPNWLLFFFVILSQITVICRSSVFSLGPLSWSSQGGRQVPRW